MATTNPQTFFRFAAEHHALLCELYYKRDGPASELGDAIDAANSDLLVRVNRELEEHVERIRHDSHSNRERVISDVIRIKTTAIDQSRRLPPRQRYEIINRLWTRYIVPLRDIIDTQKSMDAALVRLSRVYVDAQARFATDTVVRHVVRGGEARVRRLRRDVNIMDATGCGLEQEALLVEVPHRA